MHQHGKRKMTLSLVALLLVSASAVGGQDQRETKKEQVKIRATEVVVDAIITDRKGRMIADLTAADFEIYEDGVKQVIKSARLERGAAGDLIAPASNKTADDSGPPPEGASDRALRRPRRRGNLVVLVFDNQSLSRQSQVFARRAANNYVDSLAAGDRLAVFGIDRRLFLVEPFTDDKKQLKKAVDKVARGNSQQFASSANAIERLLQSQSSEGLQPGARLAAADTYTPGPSGENLSQELDAMLLSAFRSFEVFDRQLQGRSTVTALLALIQGQKLLPGRKTVVFFSEGFSLPSDLSPQFKSVIGSANRANVSFYTIDAGGLRVESEGNRSSRELSALANARASGADPTIVRGGESMLGRAESLSRFNRESVLTELADSTGGFAIRNTNDLRSGMQRIDADMRAYYVLSFEPANQNFDGRFRTIELKVSRPDVRIRARNGYFALRSLDSSPVFDYERPLLELIYSSTPPTDFPIRIGAMHFPTATDAVNAPILADIPLSTVTFTQIQPASQQKKKKKKKRKTQEMYGGNLGVLALVKDVDGFVVRKLSQDYRLKTTPKELEDFKNSSLLFYRNVNLRPGAYELDVVARDAPSGRASVSRTPLIIPASQSSSLRISSIVPTNGSEKLKPEEFDDTNPLHFQQTAIMPNLERAFSKTSDQPLMFYFMVQATPGASVQAKVEFLQGGQVLAQAADALPPPDEKGRIQFIASFPSAPFPQGAYSIRVTVDDGTNKVRSRETPFRVVN